jgi:small-conductance mechanosensitive channel
MDFTHELSLLIKRFNLYLHSDKFEGLITGLFLMLMGFLIAKGVRNGFMRTMGNRFNSHQKLIWGRGIFYFIFLLFVVSGLREMGLKLSVFLGAAGILTVAIGFASQTSASNLISGLFILGEGAFEVGDMIQITLIRGQTIEGEVLSIDLMSVKLRTLDNVFIRVPNEQLIKTPVMNLTRFPIRRIPITIAVDYKEDLGKVRRVLLDLASEYPLVLDEPKAIVTVQNFKESNIELLFAVWTRTDNYLKVRDEIQEIVRNGFVEHDIAIPFPQITVNTAMPLPDAQPVRGV